MPISALPRHPQPGIFALGIPEHCFLEFDLRPGAGADGLKVALAGLTGPATTVAGVSVVVGLHPRLWPHAGTAPFSPVEGPEVTFPATQHDAWVWVAGGSRDVVFDNALWIIEHLGGAATVASETGGWLYQHKRDLTGFVDGTENPPVLEAPGVAAGEDGVAVVLYQLWQHQKSWRGLTVAQQEKVIGRTKPDSVELAEDVMPDDSHVSRNVVEEDGEELAIYRRNVAYGGPTDHGTVFVGFCATQRPLQTMLDRMAGRGDGVRDALTRHTTALSGAYYVIPAVEDLAALLPDE